MDIGKIAYLAASIAMWFFLAVMAGAVLRPGFPAWLQRHEKMMVVLLGTNRMPDRAEHVLRRFYLFLFGGWTWLLVWSWWIMPVVKNIFFRNISSPAALQVARISGAVVLFGYAATGFFAIGKAITIWFKEIYSQPLPGGREG